MKVCISSHVPGYTYVQSVLCYTDRQTDRQTDREREGSFI